MKNIEWQNIAVFLIITAALAYVARRGWSRLRSFTRARQNDSTCATGCGNCGSEKTASTKSPNATVLVQLSRRR